MTRSSHREVWFIRHGESVANAGARTIEAATYPLSNLGFRQAGQLAAALEVEPDLIVVSPYVRARQTAEPAIRRFPNARVEEWRVHEVQYLSPALCVDTTQDDRNGMALAYWQRCDPHHAEAEAESFAEFCARVGDAIESAARRSERRIFVFCHGRVMQAIAWLVLTRPAAIDGAAMREFSNFMNGVAVPNCAILKMHCHADGARTLAGICVPEGIESGTAERNQAVQAGV